MPVIYRWLGIGALGDGVLATEFRQFNDMISGIKSEPALTAFPVYGARKPLVYGVKIAQYMLI
jgi:hypothetical protein